MIMSFSFSKELSKELTVSSIAPNIAVPPWSMKAFIDISVLKDTFFETSFEPFFDSGSFSTLYIHRKAKSCSDSLSQMTECHSFGKLVQTSVANN